MDGWELIGMAWKIVKGDGAGGFLSPPGHPAHAYAVEERSSRGTLQSSMGLESAVKADYVPDAVRLKAAELLAGASLTPSELWVRNVYGYMRNMWTRDGSYGKADDLLSGRPEGAPDEWHAAVVTIRQYFPDHAPRLELIADPGKGYGSWPCVKCGEVVQYEARVDALCVVRSSPWSYNAVCTTDGGSHAWEVPAGDVEGKD